VISIDCVPLVCVPENAKLLPALVMVIPAVMLMVEVPEVKAQR
jgi:hypothetical protein